jgi:hypothetical protein
MNICIHPNMCTLLMHGAWCRDQLLEVDIEPNSVTYLLRQGSELVIAHQGEDVKLRVGHPVSLEIKAF